MGMSMHVYGVRPPDADYLRYKAVWEACAAIGTQPPQIVRDFFKDEPPDQAGVVVDLKSTEYSAEMQSGLEVDIAKLPAGVKLIRFVCSY